jgi:hypothetical protein
MGVMRIVRALLVVTLACGALMATPASSEAASYPLMSCTQAGSPAPAGFDQVTVEVTGSAPAGAELGDFVSLTGVTVTLHNPNAFAIDASSVSIGVPAPAGASAVTVGFASPFPFSIPAGGSAVFSGALEYIATGAPGTVLEFRPNRLTFNLPGTGVTCAIPATVEAFATTTVLDVPGYQFDCFVPALGVTIQQTIDIVGTAPPTVVQGASFSLSDVVTTSTPPITTTVLSTTFTLASPPNATPSGPLSVTTAGPGTVQAGVPYSSAPMTFDFVATGPPGSVVEFRPDTLTTQTQEFGAVNCTVLAGQPPIATTTVNASNLDEVLVVAVQSNGQVGYAQHATLSSGDFDLAHEAGGALVGVEGQGTFEGPSGGTSELRVRYERPFTRMRVQDSATGLDLRAVSLLPAVSPDPTVAVGVAFGRLGKQSVLVLWAVRDLG